MLPGLDGFELPAAARLAATMVPVVFLTARDGVADRVAGLDPAATTTWSNRSPWRS